MLSLRELRDGEFLLERRLAYRAMLLCGIAYVFDTRGFWLLALAIAAGRLIWLRRSDSRDARGVAVGLLGRVIGDSRFWVWPLVLSALFIAQARRYRDAAVLLERARAASATPPQGALHSPAAPDGPA